MMDYDKYRTRGAYHYQMYEKGEPAWYKKCVDKCVEFCKGPTLDVGCGEGLVVEKIMENGFDAVGIDNDPTAIELSQVPTMLHDLSYPLPGSWEYMVCLNVIEHLEHPEAIKRIFNHNITKAAIIITDIPQEHPSPYHIKEFDPYELKQLFHTRKVKHFYVDDEFHGVEVYKT